MNGQNKYWCFTLNNPQEELAFDASIVAYATWQKERGDQGTEHYQGYVEFKTRRRLGFVRSIIPRAHWEIRRGSAEQAISYCNKEESRIAGPYTFGSRISGQGRRNDLVSIQRELDQGTPLCKIFTEYFESSARYHRFFREYALITAKPRSEFPEVICIIGSPGLGKSKEAFECSPPEQQYWKPSGDNWWDSYFQHPVTIIDEFYGWLRVDFVLRLLDRYPFYVPHKGGYTVFNSPKIIFTSNKPPWKWWNIEFDKRALFRRIGKIVYYGGTQDAPIREEYTSVDAFFTISTLMRYFE